MRFWRGLTAGALAILWLGLIGPILPVQAATGTIYYSPNSVKLDFGKTATISVYVSSTSQSINTAGGTVVLPANVVQATSVSKTGSIMSTWPVDPVISGSTIAFGGGLPTPGYTGSGGKIFSFTIKGTGEGTGLITLSGGKVLANDGYGTNIFSGSPTATVTVSRTISGATITSSTHPDPAAWYNKKDAALAWTKPAGTSTFSFTLSSDSGLPSQSLASTTAQKASFSGLADGIWTFTLTTKFTDGKTVDSSYTIRVDTTTPNPFTVTVKQTNGNLDPFPTLEFTTTDKPSGVDHYEIVIDTSDPIITSTTPYKLPRQQPGSHQVTVKAVDKAGNSTTATSSFEVQGFPGPTITSAPNFVATLQPITFKGQALFGTTVHLYVDGKDLAQFVVRENLTDTQKQSVDSSTIQDDQSVEWTFTFKGVLLPGKHQFYAVQVKPDTSVSNPSNQVEVRVLAGTISIGRIIIPMAFVLISLLIVLIGLILLLVVFWRKARGKFVDWRKRLQGLRSQIDNELGHLEVKVDTDVDQSVEHAKELRREVTNEIEKAQDAIDQSIDTLSKDAPTTK